MENIQSFEHDYTIPSDNRELQQSRYQDHILAIIPYQVITGNYNEASASIHALNIIPYQVIMRKIRKVY